MKLKIQYIYLLIGIFVGLIIGTVMMYMIYAEFFECLDIIGYTPSGFAQKFCMRAM